jgi:hypothetical protein
VVNPSQAVFLTVSPSGSARPLASNVNYAAGQTTSNRVIVALPADGRISIFASASADVVVDVSGSFSSAGGSGTEFSAEPTPVRVCDTRGANPSALSGPAGQCRGEAIGPARTLTVKVAGLAGVPAGVKAVVVNLTGIAPTAADYLSVYPGGTLPDVSDLNLVGGEVRANLVVATVNADGTISIDNSAGLVDVAVDVFGWYA